MQLFSFVIVSLEITITDSCTHTQKFLEKSWFGQTYCFELNRLKTKLLVSLDLSRSPWTLFWHILFQFLRGFPSKVLFTICTRYQILLFPVHTTHVAHCPDVLGQDGWTVAQICFVRSWNEAQSRSIISPPPSPNSTHQEGGKYLSDLLLHGLKDNVSLQDTAGNPKWGRQPPTRFPASAVFLHCFSFVSHFPISHRNKPHPACSGTK